MYKITLAPPLGTGEKYDAVQRFTCKSVVGDLATVVVSTDLKTPPKAPADAIPLWQMMPQGEVVFDVKAGRLHSAKLTIDKELKDQFGNKTRAGELGVRSNAMVLEKVPLLELPGRAIAQTGDMLEAIVVTLGQLVIGDRSLDDLGGPIKTAQISGQQASLGFLPLVWLMAVISVNLGFINLLPIPMLDGGHLLFYVIEGIIGRPVSQAAQEWSFRIGLSAILMLMVLVSTNDFFMIFRH